MRLLIVNFAGDIRTDFHRLASGGDETYYAQKYSLEAYAGLKKYADKVATLVYITQEAYNVVLPNGVQTIGCGFHEHHDIDVKTIIQLIEEYNPTHLILSLFDTDVLNWAVSHNIPTLTTFLGTAPTRNTSVLHRAVRRIKNQKIVMLLNKPVIQWIGSYGINSSRRLQRLGVRPEKIIPWDFLVDSDPGSFSPKPLSFNRKNWNLCYVGNICESKGVGDLLKAVKRLKEKSLPIHLDIVGSDHSNFAKDLISKLGIQDCVNLLGFVPNHTVEPLMNQADLVIVPSHHTYPEGFPLVIHHALRACTPIVASDHPMFEGYLQHGVNAMIFPEGNVPALSSCIEEVLTNAELYERISKNSHETWHQLRLPVKWADLANQWLSQTPSTQQWLASHSLAKINKQMAIV
ncbi:glycosyltransferase family 4 protein [Nodosilinea sp. FACHB-131]|uniref:glycosyltransferase n=1 Tax=Cyanophyceae TaxID=3028117 RepID=UPI0016849E9D|nr:glycosyltransferase [Nodosilinea sp. FACHB-131]MBD1873890.1 glycosyltransferase family 4 protein [Nodosilinea sp. FACHB-131]